MTPQLAVLLPFYNAEATLAETLDSILAQTFKDFVLIAVDDGSTDNSCDIVHDYIKQDKRIELLQVGHQGVVAAMNHALEHCSAPICARMDADDIMAPKRLALQLDYLNANPDIALVGSRVRLFPEEIIQDGFNEYIRWQNACITPQQIADNIYVELPIANPSICFRRHVVLEVGGYRDGDFPEDYELLLRLHQQGHQMAKLPAVLLHWRDSTGRLTRTDQRYSRTAFDRIRAEYLAADPRLQQGRPLAYWGAGRVTRRRTAHLIGYGHRPQVWIDIDPGKIGRSYEGAEVVAPHWLVREDKPFVLSYVSNHGARELIVDDLESMGYSCGQDYLIVG
ncbi:MAG: glycosyltransferase [Gammaproteobacteria bacterium]|nr:glycosyltransferase [Gammaproteobacteria bacterium]MCW8924590.1 glycosyltransferase [Gammaproteobacteria bacterium]